MSSANGILDAEAVVVALRDKPPLLHVILTGRYAHPLLLKEMADMVTEMREGEARLYAGDS